MQHIDTSWIFIITNQPYIGKINTLWILDNILKITNFMDTILWLSFRGEMNLLLKERNNSKKLTALNPLEFIILFPLLFAYKFRIKHF